MTRIKKTITLFLLLPILIMNFPMGFLNSCMAKTAMEHMGCCTFVKHAIEQSKENINSQPCECSISNNQNSELPLQKSVVVLTPNPNEYIAKSESNSHLNKSAFDPSFFVSNFDILFQAGLSSNIKIYNLISAYLI